jgi:hypothetical protein
MTQRDATRRFCAECKQIVHDLSALTEQEARALLDGPQTDGLCVRYLHDGRGQLVFRAEPLVEPSRLARAKRAAAALLAIAAPLGLTACMGALPPKAPLVPPTPPVEEAPPAAPQSEPAPADGGRATAPVSELAVADPDVDNGS